jgi:hypothetical protein
MIYRSLENQEKKVKVYHTLLQARSAINNSPSGISINKLQMSCHTNMVALGHFHLIKQEDKKNENYVSPLP